MIYLRKLFLSTILAICALSSASNAKQYPRFNGEILTEMRVDSIFENDNNQDIEKVSGYFNFETKSSLNFNENWSLKNSFNLIPVYRRQYIYPERSRFILGVDRGNDRGINIDDSALIAEEIKIAFENEDLKFAAGKINPTFATLYRRNKRIGFFVTDVTEDYELRERIGLSISTLLEDSEITLNSFFNDASPLSNSGINYRKKARSDDGIAGNTNSLSSYSLTMEGRDFIGIRNLFYNIGYRSLGVKKSPSPSLKTAREVGYTLNLEYLYQVTENTYLIPIIEAVKIDNFTGLDDRDAMYITTSIVAKYSGWNASASYIARNIKGNYPQAPVKESDDSILQLNIGYKFQNNIAIDVSRAKIKEDDKEATLFGVIVSYLYEF